MPTSTLSDMVIYEEQFYGGFTETLEQETEAFNAASRGCIVLSSEALKGQYEQESYFDLVSNLVSRRDPTSVAVVADDGLAQSEIVRVKLNRRAQVGFTRDQFRKIMQSPQEGSFIFGQQLAKAIMVDYLDAAVRSAVAGLTNTGATVVFDGTAGTLTHINLVNGLQLFGDKAPSILCWVMHSKTYYDLVKEGITNTTYQTNSVSIFDASTPTLGRPVVVTDAAPLITAGVPDTYHTLGLTASGLTVVESEASDIVQDTITGQENIIERIQYESAFNVGLKGYAYDITNGGPNPNDATLGTATNWDIQVTDIKTSAGIMVNSQ